MDKPLFKKNDRVLTYIEGFASKGTIVGVHHKKLYNYSVLLDNQHPNDIPWPVKEKELIKLESKSPIHPST